MGTNYAKSQGTGLGLPISHSIVQLDGWRTAGVKSEPGYGSEFYFTLTLPVGSPVYDGVSVNERHVGEELLKEVRILLAEDNDLNAEIAIQLLELKGAVVSRSENGRLAVERFKESDPGEFQVILMDIQMPEMNGLEATGGHTGHGQAGRGRRSHHSHDCKCIQRGCGRGNGSWYEWI